MDSLDQQDPKVLREILGQLVQLDQKDLQGKLVQRDHRDLQDLQED